MAKLEFAHIPHIVVLTHNFFGGKMELLLRDYFNYQTNLFYCAPQQKNAI
jgi:hypothetical protein